MLETALTFSYEALGSIFEQVKYFTRVEAGGLLAGRGNVVLYNLAIDNAAADQACEFAIALKQMADLMDWIAEEGVELIGSYHSHPNGNAQMSSADAAMARSTGMLLIVAPGSPWQWRLWDPVAGGEVGFAIAPPRA